jgi:hypothetical protein
LYVFGDDANAVASDLQESATHQKLRNTAPAAYLEGAAAQQRHERGVTGKDTNLTVKRRRHYGVGVAVEHSCLRGDDRDSHHEVASFLAFSTASSIPPTM